jgi:hypothetical protein
MSVPLRTRSDLKAAGRAMATEAVEALTRHMASLTQAELDDVERIDALTHRMMTAAEHVATEYRAAGIPEAWVAKFLTSFRRTAAAQCHALSFIVRPVAGTA